MRAPLPPLLLLVLLAGCAAPASQTPATTAPTASNAQTLTGNWTLAAHGANELNFNMPAGGKMSYELNASAPVDWDVHSHPANEVKEWATGSKARHANGSFEAPTADVYSVYVSATGSTTRVLVQVTGDVTEWVRPT